MPPRDRRLANDVANDVADDLEVVGAALRDRVDGAMRAFRADFVAATICLWPEDPEAIAVDLLSAGSLGVRNAAAGEALASERFRRAWDPHCFEIVGVELVPLAEFEGFPRAEARILAAAAEAGVEDAGYWALNEALVHLNERPPANAAPDGFIAYVFDDQFGEDLVRNIEVAGQPKVIAALRDDGLLPGGASDARA